MKLVFEDKAAKGLLSMSVHDHELKGEGVLNGNKELVNTFVLNRNDAQQVTIDEVAYTMPANSMLALVANQHFVFERPDELVAWQFNREFYCISDHDAEVGCVGFLFYGIHHPMFITIDLPEMQSIGLMEQLFREDMILKDTMQGEMLRTLLKRLIIQITRIAKTQTQPYQQFPDEKMDIIRKFNLLLEVHYRKEHEVSFYAGAMNKSPKTLTNFFNLCNYPSPSSLIHKRIILEAKRYLYYTDKSAKEIGYELGFTSPAHFSRFFKLKTGNNISLFRNVDWKELHTNTAWK